MKPAKQILFEKFTYKNKYEKDTVTLEIEIMADKICAAMEEFALQFRDDNGRAKYYEDKIDMLNRVGAIKDKTIESQKNELCASADYYVKQRVLLKGEIEDWKSTVELYKNQVNDLINRTYPAFLKEEVTVQNMAERMREMARELIEKDKQIHALEHAMQAVAVTPINTNANGA